MSVEQFNSLKDPDSARLLSSFDMPIWIHGNNNCNIMNNGIFKLKG